MRLTRRDKAIIDDLNRFRVMDRDSISELHFNNLKNPILATNNVLLRLVREGKIQRSEAFQPFVYFGPDVSMKKNSAKIGHFLAILNAYKEILQHGKVDIFLVEPKYGDKGTAEPDIFCIFNNNRGKLAYLFIEVQKSVYSEKQMSEKLDRYNDLYNSGLIYEEPWQPVDKKVFPRVLILSEQRYAVDTYPFKVIQAPSFTHFLQSLKPKDSNEHKRPPVKQETIKIKPSNGTIKLNFK